jgi:hypothetical protein
MIIFLYQRVLNDFYRGPGFLEMIRLLRLPLPPSPVSKLSLFLSLPVCCRSSLLTGEGGGRGAESYDRKKAWSSINNFCTILYNVHTYLNIRGNGERKTEGAHSHNSHPHIHAENKFQ